MKHNTSLHYFLQETTDSLELRELLLDITRAAKYVQYAIRNTEHGLAGSTNIQGEEQVALDVVANDLFKKVLHENAHVSTFISEEEETEVSVSQSGMYSVVFDPLDGSSLVSANLSIGSIFGIYSSKSAIGCKPVDQVAALYVLYGPRTLCILSTGKGVHEFLLDEIGEFVLLNESLTVAAETTYYSPGNLRALADNQGYKRVLDHWLESSYTLRYSGCMVADIHHIFTKGQGVFTNVGGSKYPHGKLRHAFECGPFGYLMEQAGGMSSTGTEHTTAVQILDPHQRTPLIIGSTKEVENVVRIINA